MKKQTLSLVLSLTLTMVGCGKKQENMVKCYNGNFVGMQLEGGIKTFKGIPFAQPPVGNRRWKAPLPVEASDKTFDATKFGHVALQAPDPSGGEVAASSPDKSEDCLTLNVWVSDSVLHAAKRGKKPNSPIMVYIHGGAYWLGGTIDPLYDGEYLVREYPDIIVVTMNYRLNFLGMLDLSHVPGYTDEFKDAPYLNILDQQQALRWIQQNIAQFGGNKENITLFGESAGGGSTSSHLTAKGSEGLFRRVIIMSGAPDLTMTKDVYEHHRQAEAIMEATGAKNIDELMSLSEDVLKEIYFYPTDRTGLFGMKHIMGLSHFPLRGSGSIIPEDPFMAIENGASKDVDMMIGTTWDEFNYWGHLFHKVINPNTFEMDTTGENPLEHYYQWVSSFVEHAKHRCGDNGKAINRFEKEIKSDFNDLEDKYPHLWNKVDLVTELFFRQGSILAAESHNKATGKGKTYMYYFGKGYAPNAIEGQPWVGAMHACELTYAFNQPDFPEEGPYDAKLTKQFSQAFVNFARTGNPSQEGLEWSEYDMDKRNTMVIERDATMHIISDPRADRRKILAPVFKTFFKNKKSY